MKATIFIWCRYRNHYRNQNGQIFDITALVHISWAEGLESILPAIGIVGGAHAHKKVK